MADKLMKLIESHADQLVEALKERITASERCADYGAAEFHCEPAQNHLRRTYRAMYGSCVSDQPPVLQR